MKASITVNPQQAFNRLFTRDVMFYANSRLRAYCDPYVPYKSGDLSQNVNTTADYNEYVMPYANRQYNGKDFNFSRDGHLMATAEWDKAMAVAKGQQLADDISEYIKRGKS